MSEDDLRFRAESAEANLNALKGRIDSANEDARNVLDTFAARKRSNGSFDIDYQKFVERLGKDSAMELRAIIDEVYPDTLHLKKEANG